jgi:hypothetical protein
MLMADRSAGRASVGAANAERRCFRQRSAQRGGESSKDNGSRNERAPPKRGSLSFTGRRSCYLQASVPALIWAVIRLTAA